MLRGDLQALNNTALDFAGGDIPLHMRLTESEKAG